MSKINLLPLGGMDEKNKSLYLLEIDSKIYIIDAGIHEPLRDDFGIQHFMPRLDYLELNKDKIKGIFLSSLNRQQIGSISEIVRLFPKILIFASEIVVFCLKQYFKNTENWNFKILEKNVEFTLDNQIILPLGLPSAMPGTLGFVFKTRDGNIIYLSDYISESIEEFEDKDLNLVFNSIQNERNLLLLSDSLNASIEGSISNRFRIKKYIEQVFTTKQERIIASVYEDEIINILELLKLAKQNTKEIYIYEKMMFDILNFLIEKKYIEDFKINLFNENLKKENTILIITGSRTNLYVKLQSILIAEEGLTISKNDIVFLASPPQPGNEHIYAEIANDLARIDPIVIETPSREKVSIHPSKEDLKKVIKILKPQFLMPIKGYYKEFLSSSNLARSLGIDFKNIIMGENGEVFSFENGSYQGLTRKIKEIGNTIIQLATEGGIELEVIKARETLASEGVLTISFLVDKITKKIKSNVDIQMKGIIWMKTQDQLIHELSDKVFEIIEISKNDWIINKIESNITKELHKILRATIKKAPYIIIRAIEV